jgi:nitrogen fixation protein FixH
MSMQAPGATPFTGRRMLAIMIAFFGVIIGANVTMAVFAGSSWTGLVVRNSYAASQEFNAKVAEARRQAALGWSSRLDIADGRISFALRDGSGDPVTLDGVQVSFHRPVTTEEDTVLALQPAADGSVGIDWLMRDGVWILEIAAEAGLDHPYRERMRVVVAQGRRQ